MEIEVKGHSGCSIEIIRRKKVLYIEKSTNDTKYVERLYQQALKQQCASETKLPFIRIPKILRITKTPSRMSMQMEYIYSKNFIDYFETAGFEQISYFVNAIDQYLKSEIERSFMTEVSNNIVLVKFADVDKKTRSNVFLLGNQKVETILLRSAEVFRSLPQSMYMPVGVCHGDLTLSNILFNANHYFLIDFLDSFIESPLIDMVKIRQDTAHHWSPLMYDGDFDHTRYNIISKKIDTELDAIFSQYIWYRQYYEPFQLMNMLRVLQYAHEQCVVDYLVKEISHILDEMNV